MNRAGHASHVKTVIAGTPVFTKIRGDPYRVPDD